MAKNLENILLWIKNNGGFVGNVYFKQHNKERSVFTHKSINSGDIPIKIPLSCIIHDGLGEKTKYGIIFNNNDNSKIINKKLALIAIFMLEEMQKEDSFYLPYFNSLPDDVSNFPIFWSDNILFLLRGSELFNAIQDRKKEFINDYTTICNCCKGFDKHYSFEDFLYVRVLIGSRNFGITINGIKRSAMVPLADMLNHSPNQNVDWTFNDTNKYFEMTANKHISNGTQLEDSYGKKNNIKMLIYYGFLIDNNPLDSFSFNINYGSHSLQLKIINNPHSINNAFNKIIGFLRSIVINSSKPHINTPFKKDKELFVCKIIHNYLLEYLAKFETPAKLEKVSHNQDNNVKRQTINMVIGEINIIKKLQQTLNKYIKVYNFYSKQ